MTGESLVIKGKRKLSGEIEVSGSKNAAFPVLAATLLVKEDCFIGNVPIIEDVLRFLEIMKSMGAKVEWVGKNRVRVNAKNIDPKKMNSELVLKIRGAVLFLGPLLGRFSQAKLIQPGGCHIGVRPIDTHLDTFSQMGVKVKKQKNYHVLKASQKQEVKTVILDELSVTATANVMLYASSLKKPVIIRNADADYPNQELGIVLEKMGVKVEGIGTHNLKITGAKKLKGFSHNLVYDPIEAGTFIILAVATNNDILIKNVEYPFLEFVLKKLKDAGVRFDVIKKKKNLADIRVYPWNSLRIKKIQSLPYPGIPSDLLQVLGVLATQTHEQTLIHDPLYEGRLKYLEGLIKMGADIFFSDPHRATITGPTRLYGADLGSFDLRGGAALIIAGLIADGETIIRDIYEVDRGYERIDEKLKKIGADIKRIK